MNLDARIEKFGMVVPISREILLDLGMVERTPAEQAAHDAEMAEWDAKVAAAQPGIRKALWRLDQIGGFQREVLDLHSRSDGFSCDGCDFGGYEGEPPAWPCRTVELIANRHGIDLSNFHLYDPEAS